MVDVLMAQGENRELLAGMSFRAVLAGWLVATGIAVLLFAGGLAMGFSAFDAWHAQASAKGIGIGTSIWMVLTWVVSLALGGMFASWYAAHDDRTIGTLHGVIVWALAVTVVFFWVATGLGAMHRENGPMHANMAPPAAGMPADPHRADRPCRERRATDRWRCCMPTFKRIWPRAIRRRRSRSSPRCLAARTT
jgi:hypothetical protein